MQYLHPSMLSLIPMSWTRGLTGMRPLSPEFVMISLADRQTGIPSRIRILRRPRINTSASARRPD
eukprot:6972128-Pyramimonas_sp.AAC.2